MKTASLLRIGLVLSLVLAVGVLTAVGVGHARSASVTQGAVQDVIPDDGSEHPNLSQNPPSDTVIDVEAQAVPPDTHWACYYTPGGGDPSIVVDLLTQFGLENDVDVGLGELLCAPAVKTRAGQSPEGDLTATHLRAFQIAEPAPDPPITVRLTDQFNPAGFEVEVGPAVYLSLPVEKWVQDPAGMPDPPTLEAEPHYKCYAISGQQGPYETVTVETQFTTVGGVPVEVQDPFLLCVPAGKNGAPIPDAPHGVCYWASLPAPFWIVGLITQFYDDIGFDEAVEVWDGMGLCVPAVKEVVELPTATPTATPTVTPTPTEGPAEPEPHYYCYFASGYNPDITVDLETQFGLEEDLQVGYGSYLCAPAVKQVGQDRYGTLDGTHLRMFDLSNENPRTPPGQVVNLSTQFGDYDNVEIDYQFSLAMPVEKLVTDPPPPEICCEDPALQDICGVGPDDGTCEALLGLPVYNAWCDGFDCQPLQPEPPAEPHYKCYYIFHSGLPPANQEVVVETQFGSEQVLVGYPALLCLPAGKNGAPIPDAPHEMCYLAYGLEVDWIVDLFTQFAFPPFEPPFWEEFVTVVQGELLCVPAVKEVVGEATATPTATPTVTPWATETATPTLTPTPTGGPTQPEDPTFSIHRDGPSAQPAGPFDPADLLMYGPAPMVPCPVLGLMACNGGDDIDAISIFGDWDQPPPDGKHWLAFSVTENSVGAAGSAVSGEYSCIGSTGAEPEADEFDSKALGSNRQVFDGDGLVCDGNAGFPMNLAEPQGDDLDALDDDTPATAQPPVYFSLDPLSPSLTMPPIAPGSPADIFVSFAGGDIAVYASAGMLMLQPDDDIDALCIRDMTDESWFDPMMDVVVFSLAAGSPSLPALGGSAADLWFTMMGMPVPYVSAQQLGLNPALDDLNALKCYQEQAWPDSDGNGLPDQWEAQQWCSPLGTGLDWDGDWLTDDVEFGMGTDPCVMDTDGDGCTDSEEPAGAVFPKPGGTGAYNPLFFWDYYDVPVPANADPAPNGARNGAISIGDVLAVLFYAGAANDGVPNGNGVDYDSIKGSCDINGDGVWDEEGLCYDRTPGPLPTPPDDASVPNGAIAISDVLAALAEAGLNCGLAP